MKIFLLALLITSAADARWMKVEEAEASLDHYENHITVKKDGRSISESVTRLKILNEKGRGHFGTLRYSYTPKNYDMQIKTPATLSGALEYPVEDKDIVDTPLQATEGGFDELRQIVISFPHVEIGSTLSLKTVSKIHKPIFPNQFSERFVFGQSYPQSHLDLTITSEIPLYIELNDPEQAIDFEKQESGKEYTYKFKLKKTVYHEVTDEVRSFLPSRSFTWIVVSSDANYEKMFSPLAEIYEKSLKAPLPKSLQHIVDEAHDIKDPIQQMNHVLSAIAGSVRYMGDWRSIDGGFVPRSLELIAATHFGDCKDMSLLTSKILQLLGYNAHISLVQRGSWPDWVPDVPYNAFNHAIVSVILADGRRLWLDPTNFQSYAQGVMDDISDRKSLIMKSPTPELQEIEFTTASDTKDETHFKYFFKNESHRLDEVTMLQTGYFAAQHAGLGIDYSNQQIQEEILQGNIDKGDVYKYEFSPFDLKSRVVTPIRMTWKVDHRYRSATTSMGSGFTIRTPLVISDLNRLDLENRKSDYNLGTPSTTLGHGIIENFQVIGNKIRNCDIRSPWVDYQRNVIRAKNASVQMEDKMVIKTRWIKLAEMQKPEFKKLVAEIQNCSSDQLLIYRVPHSTADSK